MYALVVPAFLDQFFVYPMEKYLFWKVLDQLDL
jgi:hypothetical protein